MDFRDASRKLEIWQSSQILENPWSRYEGRTERILAIGFDRHYASPPRPSASASGTTTPSCPSGPSSRALPAPDRPCVPDVEPILKGAGSRNHRLRFLHGRDGASQDALRAVLHRDRDSARARHCLNGQPGRGLCHLAGAKPCHEPFR